jgi:hypothetical protein
MFRKTCFSFTLALLLPLLAIAPAFAAGTSGDTARPASRFGQVISVAKDIFTLQNSGKAARTIKVNKDTQFVKPNGSVLSFENVDPGQWVIAYGTVDKGEFVASQVVLMRKSINQGSWIGKRATGEVISTNPTANTIFLHTPQGNLTYVLNDKTTFQCKIKRLADLKPGMTANLSYRTLPDGTLTVRSVIAY